MTPQLLADMEHLVDWRLQTFRDHCEWEDIRQEGLIAAWRAWSKHPELRFATVVCAAARWGALEYLRSKRCRQPRREPGEIPAPSMVLLSEADLLEDPAQDEEVRLSICLARQIRGELWALLPPRERQAVWLVYGLGYSWAEAGRRMGCNHRNVHRLAEQGFDRYRERHGIPGTGAGLNSSQRRRKKEGGSERSTRSSDRDDALSRSS